MIFLAGITSGVSIRVSRGQLPQQVVYRVSRTKTGPNLEPEPVPVCKPIMSRIAVPFSEKVVDVISRLRRGDNFGPHIPLTHPDPETSSGQDADIIPI